MEKPARRRSSTKALQRQAEVAAGHFMKARLGCCAIRRAVRTQWQKVDFFGADLVGVLSTGAKIYVQVTTGSHSAMSARRAKLGDFPWHPSETVLLLNLVATVSPAKGRKTEYWFRVEELARPQMVWNDWPEPIPVPRGWFKTKSRDDQESTQDAPVAAREGSPEKDAGEDRDVSGDAWRAVTMEAVGVKGRLLDRLVEADLATLGAWSDWHGEGRYRARIAGIGKGAINRIADLCEAFWARRPYG